MALVVEDGTGKADADAFVSLADCETYHQQRGNSGWTGAASSPSDAKDAAIRRATSILSTGFAWKGTKLKGRSQALAWPRSGAEDGEGDDIPSDEVPDEIVNACCEMALRELVKPGSLTPDVQLNKQVKATGVGPLSKEYFAAPLTAESARPVLLIVNDMIGGLLAGSSNALVGSAVRS